jgi:PIN domain nuclease of toxin-antitoxin system
MRYLLDTHAILWYVEANPDFPPELRELIDSSECLYSVASLWEIAIKQSLGRLPVNIAISDLDQICRRAGFRPLPVLPPHLDRLKTLPSIHRDPFDRLLVAQALEEGLAIVTRDRLIPQYPVQTVW